MAGKAMIWALPVCSFWKISAMTHQCLSVLATASRRVALFKPRRLVLAVLAMAAASLPLSGWAQAPETAAQWPKRSIRVISPWSAGSGTDIVARLISERLRQELGVPVVVEARTGASGNIGAELAARQPADGYTFLITSASFAIAPSLFKSLSYDPLKDFVAVTKIATAPLLVLVPANSPIRSMADLIARAKKDPASVNYGSFGNGSPSHLMGESINKLAGIRMTHVPYTGGGAATDLQGGSLTMAILDALSQTPQVKAGKVRALALNGTQRLPGLPDVPTLRETGVAFDSVGWHAMFAPAGTPADIIDKLNKAVNRIIAMPEVQTRLFEAGSFPVQPATTPQQWQEQFRKDVQNWGDMVRMSGATIQ